MKRNKGFEERCYQLAFPVFIRYFQSLRRVNNTYLSLLDDSRLNRIGRNLTLNKIERKGGKFSLVFGGLMISGRVRCVSKGNNKAYYGPEMHDKDFSFLMPNTPTTITNYIAEDKSIILQLTEPVLFIDESGLVQLYQDVAVDRVLQRNQKAEFGAFIENENEVKNSKFLIFLDGRIASELQYRKQIGRPQDVDCPKSKRAKPEKPKKASKENPFLRSWFQSKCTKKYFFLIFQSLQRNDSNIFLGGAPRGNANFGNSSEEEDDDESSFAMRGRQGTSNNNSSNIFNFDGGLRISEQVSPIRPKRPNLETYQFDIEKECEVQNEPELQMGTARSKNINLKPSFKL